MRADVQERIAKIWPEIRTENIDQYCDITGYWEDFYQMFGFRLPSVDYTQDIDPSVNIPSIVFAEYNP